MRLAQQGSGNSDSNTRNASMGSNVAMSGASAGRSLRPSSEMLPTVNHQATPESEAIDRWFEDLQHYEATLEEMATAALDQNFKEELSAIEQWFRVLSEAERTAALYSLLQESTQVQIRFFITVLQQMSRSDPNAALLSPSHQSTSMADQMEAKLASLGLKSPSGAGAGGVRPPLSPGNRGYRQSSDAAGYLSPNVATSYNSSNSDAASTLAAQRAKLKANRTSAPGTLLSEHRNFSGGHLDQVQERGGSPNPQQQQQQGGFASDSRPKSTDYGNALGRSPRASGPLDDQLSPITNTGSWASMANTPMVPMFSDADKLGHGEANVNVESAAAQLANLGHHSSNPRTLVDPDPSRFRRKSNQNGGSYSAQNPQMMYDQSSPGVSPNLGAPQSATGWGQNDHFGRGGLNPPSSAFGQTNFNIPPLSPNALGSGQLNMQMMNTMAAMGGGLNLNNMSAGQLLAIQQQQILQNQQNLALLAAQQQQQQILQQQQQGRNLRGYAGGALSPGLGGPSSSGLKSPRTGTSPSGGRPGGPSPTNANPLSTASAGAPGGGGEEEVADLPTLNDVAAWLRQLRLHKYTSNFEHSHWKDMVLMDDAKLQDMGVAALGARRKMLKTFELVRKKYGIKMEGEDSPGSGVPSAAPTGTVAAGGEGGTAGDKQGEVDDEQDDEDDHDTAA